MKTPLRILMCAFACIASMSVNQAVAQKVALKNNLVYDAILTPNLSAEFAMGRKMTLDLTYGANFFFNERNATSPNYKTTKWSHWLVQPELRYWTCDVFNGFFIGLHGHGGEMNVGGLDIPFVLENKRLEGANQGIMKDHRYEGYFYGGGLSLGYQWIISNRFNIEASVGGGYARIHYKKFPCTSCGRVMGEGVANYVGPSKATLSLVFFLK